MSNTGVRFFIGLAVATLAVLVFCLFYFPNSDVGLEFFAFLLVGMPLAWLGIRMLFQWWEG